MVDLVSLLVAIAGVVTAAVGVGGYLSQRSQSKDDRRKIATLEAMAKTQSEELGIEKRKVVALETSAASAEKQLALLQQNVEAMKEWVKIAQSALEAEESSVGVMTGRAIHVAGVKLKEALGRLLGK